MVLNSHLYVRVCVYSSSTCSIWRSNSRLCGYCRMSIWMSWLRKVHVPSLELAGFRCVWVWFAVSALSVLLEPLNPVYSAVLHRFPSFPSPFDHRGVDTSVIGGKTRDSFILFQFLRKWDIWSLKNKLWNCTCWVLRFIYFLFSIPPWRKLDAVSLPLSPEMLSPVPLRVQHNDMTLCDLQSVSESFRNRKGTSSSVLVLAFFQCMSERLIWISLQNEIAGR